MHYKLYHYWRSSCSWRVRWALALKKVPYETQDINLLSEDTESEFFRKKNPMGYVPVLELSEGGRGSSSQILCESSAIIEYLDETVPGHKLLPTDPIVRARCRQLFEIINAGTQPLQNLVVGHYLSSDPAEQKKWNQHWIVNGLKSFEQVVKVRAGDFCIGEGITMADLALIPQVYNAKRNDVDLSPFPTIVRIFDRAMETEECKASAPERFQPKDTP